MRIKKAVITAAGRNQNRIPLQTLVDRDGKQKSALQIIIEEVTSSGIEELCVVISPGGKRAYSEAAGMVLLEALCQIGRASCRERV